MPTHSRSIVLLLAAALLTACTTTRFLAYTGEQADWPTAVGSLAEEKDGLQVYHGLPPKPYEVLGRLELERKHLLAPSTIAKAVAEAKKRGGDAVMVVEEGSRLMGYQHRMTTSNYGSASYGSSAAQYSETATVYLIRWRK